MALNNPEQVKALVLESPFDCMDSVVNDKLNRIGLADTTTAQTMGLALTRFIFTKFSPQGIRPADVAHKIRHNLPILIVCSQQDQLVPASSSAKLYTILRNSGHTQVHLLTLPEGKHAKLFNSAASSLQYKQVTHAFYKKYGLPHDEKLAFEGQKTFLECQPIFSI
jgi:alpha-beta hydrolase superfamily lysophospholipase